jgi:HEAT repeat protein
VAITAGFAPAVSARAAALLPTENVEEPVSAEQRVPVQQVVDVVRVPQTGTLAERMRVAASMAEGTGARAYWIAWVFEGAVKPGENVADDTGPWDGWQDGPAVEGVLRVASEVGPAGSGDLMVLVQQAPQTGGARVVRLALRSPGLGIDLQGRPVYWLGRALPQQSLAWSNDLFRNASQPLEIRHAAIEVVSRHALPEARQILEGVVSSRSETADVRGEAVEGLANHPADATVALLARLAVEDADPTVKEEAAETLGEVNNPRAGAALETLLHGAATPSVKEEALEALAERGDTLLAQVLLELALNDPEPDMRTEAVESMQELTPEEALPLLRRVLAESTDRDVRMQAVETVGEIGSDDALAALEVMIVERDREVALEAVEAIAEFPFQKAGPILQRIAREHPVDEVRWEAIDQLKDLDSGALTSSVLLEMAMTGADAEMRRQAVEEMEELPPEEAVAMLGRIAFDSRDPGTQRQAAETLGEIGTREALQLLDRIAREHADESVARQAVESIGEYPEDLAGPLLRRIATEHRSVRVRREAVSQLGGDPPR